MRRRLAVGVLLFGAAALVGFFSALGFAADPLASGEDTTTVLAPSTNSETVPTTETTTVPTTAQLPDTTATTTAETPTSTEQTQATPSAPSSQTVPELALASLRPTCAAAVPLALKRPHDPQVAVTAVAAVSKRTRATLKRLAYPARQPLVRVASVSARARGCGSNARARVTLRDLSVLGGAVRADVLRVDADFKGVRWRADGLVVAGKKTTLDGRRRLPVGGWGTLVLRSRAGGRLGPSVLALRFRQRYGSVPVGSVLRIGSVAGVPTAELLVEPLPSTAATAEPDSHPEEESSGHGPLTATPPLNGGPYVFPIAGQVSFVDTYGAPRSGIVWHHGDDLFAPLGTPVVAVADGVITLCGWQHRGGWRFWLRDRAKNTYYYAHLAGYTTAVQEGARVKRGQVLGFVGSTGDAITTPTHLHFEIHPRRFHPLHYDGAVNPTSYLQRWKHVEVEDPPLPVLDPPGGPPAPEQRVFARLQLLAVRRAGVHADKVMSALLERHPNAAAAARGGSSENEPSAEGDGGSEHASSRAAIGLGILGAAAALGLVPAAVFARRRRTSADEAE